MNKTAVVTGATSGIGEEFAKRFARDGYDLLITGRREPAINKVAEGLSSAYGIKAEAFVVELSNAQDLARLVDNVKSRNNVEVLVNNAGHSGYAKHFEEVDVLEHEMLIKVHNVAPLRLISAVLPGMIERRSGTIINLSSMASFLPVASVGVYCAAKAFTRVYTQALYFEVKDKGIKVQALCPGSTDTNFGKSYYSSDVMDKFRSNGLMTPEQVVDCSLRDLKKHKVVCIPGLSNKLVARLFPTLPKGLYYSMGAKMTGFK
jgi:uncharacterized protein